MTKIYSCMPHLNGNLLCAVDLETTGVRAGYHEPIQIAVLPLNSDIKPADEVRPFYVNIAPQRPARASLEASRIHKLDIDKLIQHALHPDKVADLLVEWFEDLDLPLNRRIIPLAHNWAFEYSFLSTWLGTELRDRLFHPHARDALVLASGIKDMLVMRGEKRPWDKQSLASLCQHFGVVNLNPHDALCDAIAEAEVYRLMLKMSII